MLYALKAYAEKNHIASKPGFKERTAKYIINLDRNGGFIALNGEDGDEGRTFAMAPSLEQSELVSAKTSHFLIDTVSVVLNIPKISDKQEDKEKDREKAEKEIKKLNEKHKSFIRLLSSAASHDPLVTACLTAMENTETFNAIRNAAIKAKVKATDNITFKVGTEYPADSKAWHSWWSEFRSSIRDHKKKAESGRMLCLLDGEFVQPEPTHGKIGGLSFVGGQPSGSTLVSFDKEAFESYGLKQSSNAAMGESAVSTYVGAFRELIKKAPRPLAGTIFLHWYKEDVPDSEDCFSGFFQSDGEVEKKSADSLVESLHTGDREARREGIKGNKYYILMISATGGRIMVRDYMEGEYTELYGRVNSWFEDNRIINQKGTGFTRNQKMFTILSRLIPLRSDEGIRDLSKRMDKELPTINQSIMQSIIKAVPLPDCVAVRALLYIKSKMQQSSDTDDKMQFINLDPIACGLLKAWYNRRRIKQIEGGSYRMSSELDTKNMSPAYLAGRMMAVLAEIQRKANEGKELNAGIIDRYYTSASNSPALVLGRLVDLAQHHLSNIKDRYAAERFEKMLSEISIGLSGRELPKTLSLEGKTEFALGFYYQKAFLYKNTSAGAGVRQENVTSSNKQEV